MTRWGRRRFLQTAGLGAFAANGLPAVASGGRPPDAFDPTRHAFGFRNWATDEPAYPEHEHGRVAREEVRQSVESDWRGTFNDLFDVGVAGVANPLVDVVASQVRVAANQLSASNGHCYGMVFAAQRYFENPDALPEDVDAAAEVSNPEIPLDEPRGPIGDLVDEFQATQLLDVHAWLGRRRMLRPESVDYGSELAALTAVVDAFGTAGITLVDSSTRRSHQVLVYDYRRDANGVRLLAYDPNRPARAYRHDRVALRVDPGGSPPLRGYHDFDAFVFNRWDRAIEADAESRVPAREGSADSFGHLLDCAVRFTVDTCDVSLSVVDPDGNPVGRNRSPHMDTSRTEVSHTRYRYGADSGEYRVAVVGERPATYSLHAQAAGVDGSHLDRRVEASIDAGRVHEYAARVPEGPDGNGSFRRTDDAVLPPGLTPQFDPPSVVAGALGGASLAYLLLRSND
jgi:hypothetical protein